MEGGESHTYRADSYPRYSYFQQRLKGLIPRWQKILETAGIPNCFSQGVYKLKLIIAAAENVGDKVTIHVFADDAVLKSGDLKLTTHRRWDVEKKSLSWFSYVVTADKSGDLEQTVTVIVDSNRDGRLVEELKKLPTAQQKNIIIFHADTKTSYQFTELQDKQFDASKLEHTTDEKMLERNRDLVKQIQYLLERKVMLVFEMIAEYNQGFLPKIEEEKMKAIPVFLVFTVFVVIVVATPSRFRLRRAIHENEKRKRGVQCLMPCKDKVGEEFFTCSLPILEEFERKFNAAYREKTRKELFANEERDTLWSVRRDWILSAKFKGTVILAIDSAAEARFLEAVGFKSLDEASRLELEFLHCQFVKLRDTSYNREKV